MSAPTAVRLAHLAALLLTGIGCASGDSRIDRPAASDAASGPAARAAAFAQLVHVERVRLAEPMEFVIEGVPRRETDVVLLALRVADPYRFQPRGAIGEVFVVGGVVARGLATPVFSSVLVLAVPAATPQPPDAVWLARGAAQLDRRGRADLLDLRRAADRRGPAVLLPLPPPALAAFRATPARLLDGTAELASYVRDLSSAPAAK